MSKIVIFATLFAFFLIGCNWKYCPDCTSDVEEYSPYSLGETVRFCNDNMDTINFTVTFHELYKQKDKVQYTAECSCNMVTELYNDSIKIGYEYLKHRDYSVEISCSIFCYGESNESRYSDRVIYGNDILIIADKMDLRDITNYSIIDVRLERNFGITEFKDNKKNCIWKLVR